eukprot:9177184-Pyramimonas_sp.AAC.1
MRRSQASVRDRKAEAAGSEEKAPKAMKATKAKKASSGGAGKVRKVTLASGLPRVMTHPSLGQINATYATACSYMCYKGADRKPKLIVQ